MSDTRITIDGGTILRQSHMTAHDLLRAAVDAVDQQYGDGAHKKYPQIVAAFITAAATDGGATIIAQQVRAGLDAIAEEVRIRSHDNATALGDVSDAIDHVVEELKEHRD